MSIKVFKTNKTGKIEFTRCELERLLNETYDEAYRDGENHAKSTYWTWTSPSIVNTPYYDTITCDNSATLKNNAIKVDVCPSTDEAPEALEASTKITVNETPAKTFETKGMTHNMNDLVKTVDALLSGKGIFDTGLYAHPNLNGAKKAVENDAFTNLAKELRGL